MNSISIINIKTIMMGDFVYGFKAAIYKKR